MKRFLIALCSIGVGAAALTYGVFSLTARAVNRMMQV